MPIRFTPPDWEPSVKKGRKWVTPTGCAGEVHIMYQPANPKRGDKKTCECGQAGEWEFDGDHWEIVRFGPP
jgi:hypothetical protein